MLLASGAKIIGSATKACSPLCCRSSQRVILPTRSLQKICLKRSVSGAVFIAYRTKQKLEQTDLNNQPHKPTQQPNFAQETGCQGTLPMKMIPMSKAQHTLKINRISALLLCSPALVWGGAFFFGQIALEDVPSVTVALHRVG